jgi:hypothetical protein
MTFAAGWNCSLAFVSFLNEYRSGDGLIPPWILIPTLAITILAILINFDRIKYE